MKEIECRVLLVHLVRGITTLRRFLPIYKLIHLAPVVQKVNSAIHRINLYPVDSAIGLRSGCQLYSDLSGGYRYPAFESPGSPSDLKSNIPLKI